MSAPMSEGTADLNVTGFWAVAEAHPERLALIDPQHNQMTFAEFAGLTNQIARGLLDLKLRKGDQVTTLLPNCTEQLAICLAAYQIGLYVTAINWHLVGAEINYIINDAETKALIVHADFADAAQAAVKDSVVPADNRFALGDKIDDTTSGTTGNTIAGFKPFSELTNGQSTERPPEEHLATGSFMFYTSGTTGRPKGVKRPLSERPVDEAAETAGRLQLLFGIVPHEDNVHITMAPLYHTAVSNWTLMALHFGHTIVLMDRWTAEGALERIERYKATTSHMVPTMFNRMLQLPTEVRERYDVSSLRSVLHAAAPCPVDTKRAMIDWWGDVIWEYYAATEGGGTYVSAAEWLTKPGTVGKAWPTCEVIVVDRDDPTRPELPSGESGIIYMKMGTTSFEYKDDADKTAESHLRGFFTVGDIGYLDSDGYLFLNDRAHDMIIVGGVNIYPAEIEGALVQHPAVGDVAVFGVPNDDTGEEIKAAVELVDDWTADDNTTGEIIAWLSERIARQKLPRSIDYVDELPRDPSGKLYKRRLRDPYWADHTTNLV